MITVSSLIRDYLQSLRYHASQSTLEWYRNYLATFSQFAGDRNASEITPSLVYVWVDNNYGNLSPSSQHAAARAVVRLMNWAADEQLIDRSPLSSFRKPPPSNREVLLTPPQYALCLRESAGPMRDVVKFLWHTGCRPQELRAIESMFVSGNKIVFPAGRSKGKRKRRVVFLNPAATRIAARLAAAHSVGPIFRDTRGNPWTKNGPSLAFRRLRNRTNMDGLCAYAFRHAFITRHLEAGVDVATVAAISGNSARMILEVYSHVTDDAERLSGQLL